MEIKFNKIEINNEEDLAKFMKELLDNATEDKKERKTKSKLFTELGDTAEKTGKMVKEILDEDEETVEELEMLLEAHKDVLKTCEKILENRKSH